MQFAEGGIVATEGALVSWQDPEDPGCYIPLPRDPEERRRSAEILAEVARRFEEST